MNIEMINEDSGEKLIIQMQNRQSGTERIEGAIVESKHKEKQS